MIYLNNGVNEITLTLNEKSTLTQSFYTFEMIRKGTFDSVIFYQDDFSYAPWYWNTFTVSVGTAIGLTSGRISINSGEYTYNVYASSQPYVLNIGSNSQFVETGICIVNGTYSPNQEYTGTDNSTIKYYKNM